MYLYKTIIYKDLGSVLGLDFAAIAANEVALADFETESKKDTAVEITDLEVLETTMIIDTAYANLASFITGTITWHDINYSENINDYQLYLFSEVIL